MLLPFIDDALKLFPPGLCPVFISSGRHSLHIRTYQPVYDLYRHVSKALDRSGGAFLRKKKLHKQSSERYSNRFFQIHDSFQLTEQFILYPYYLLLEDIFTTGATANEAARTLKKSGATRVYVLSMFYRERASQFYGSNQEITTGPGADTRSIGLATAR